MNKFNSIVIQLPCYLSAENWDRGPTVNTVILLCKKCVGEFPGIRDKQITISKCLNNVLAKKSSLSFKKNFFENQKYLQSLCKKNLGIS